MHPHPELANQGIPARGRCQARPPINGPGRPGRPIPAAAIRAEHGVDLIDLPDYLGSDLGGYGLRFFLGHSENKRQDARRPHLPPVGVGIQSVARSHLGDELQMVRLLKLGAFLAAPIPDFKI